MVVRVEEYRLLTGSRAPGATGSRKTRTTWRTRGRPGDLPGRQGCRSGGAEGAWAPAWSARAPVGGAGALGCAAGWSRLDARLRSSITEGVVVFLSLFDDNPAVHRSFCRGAARILGQVTGEPRPLEQVDCSLAGRVLALNFRSL